MEGKSTTRSKIVQALRSLYTFPLSSQLNRLGKTAFSSLQILPQRTKSQYYEIYSQQKEKERTRHCHLQLQRNTKEFSSKGSVRNWKTTRGLRSTYSISQKKCKGKKKERKKELTVI